jgi:hypothetical protein
MYKDSVQEECCVIISASTSARISPNEDGLRMGDAGPGSCRAAVPLLHRELDRGASVHVLSNHVVVGVARWLH